MRSNLNPTINSVANSRKCDVMYSCRDKGTCNRSPSIDSSLFSMWWYKKSAIELWCCSEKYSLMSSSCWSARSVLFRRTRESSEAVWSSKYWLNLSTYRRIIFHYSRYHFTLEVGLTASFHIYEPLTSFRSSSGDISPKIPLSVSVLIESPFLNFFSCLEAWNTTAAGVSFW